ncbi:hypothetical protein BD560DRAFT_9724 [Blakeslea trispora]|nr:hypothetical protein BD560DRAFT_9724 [Blakeslea trispora]
MTTRLDMEVTNTHIKGIENNINEIKNDLQLKRMVTRKLYRGKPLKQQRESEIYARGKHSSRQKLNQLHSEYENLSQIRLEQRNIIQAQWETYQEDTKPSRKREIVKRQKDFEKDLQLTRKEAIPPVDKQAVCNQLITILKTQDKIHILNQANVDSSIDSSVVILPNDVLELFWSIGIESVPVVESDIPSMIIYLENMLKQASK